MFKFVKFFCVFLFVFVAKISLAQKDIIITQAGEEIRCKILDETPTRFKYAYVGPNSKVLRNEIFKNLVSSFKYGYYDSDILKNEKAIVRSPLPVNPTPKVEFKEMQADKTETKDNEPKKVEAIVTPKENKSAPVNKVPEKDLARDLNKPSYPVNNQPKPAVEASPKKETSVVVTEPIKNEVKKEEVVKAKTSEIKPELNTNPELVKPEISKPEILKPETKIVEKSSPVKSEPTVNNTPKAVEKPKVETTPKPIEVKVAEKTTPAKNEISKNEPAVSSNSKSPEIKPIEKKTEVKPKEILSDRITNKPKEKEKKTDKKLKEDEPKEMANLDRSKSNEGYKNFMRFRIGVKGGLGNVVNKTSDTSPFGLYQEKLQRGWILGGDVSYFVKDWLGLGVKYASFQTNNSTNKLDFPNPISQEAVKSGSLSNKVSHKFIGPTFLVRKSIDFKTYIVLTASPGINLYSDKGVINTNNFKLSGQSYGGNATVGLDFLLGNDIFGRDIILSIEGGYNYGSINGLTSSGTNVKKSLASPINLNRLDFGVGLRFTRFPIYLR
jgi:hypothetical protein